MRSLGELSIQEKKLLVGEILNKDETGNEWKDIACMFNLAIHPDTLRKAGLGVRLAADVMGCNDGYVERQKIRDLTGKVNELYRKESRSELLRESVKEAVRNLHPYQITPCNVRFTDSEGNKEIVLCIGDSHFGADIRCQGLCGQTLNRYNEDVFKERMGKLLNETIMIIGKEQCCNIRIYLIGDLIDGILRQSQLTRLQYGLVDQVIRFSELFAGWLNSLSQYANIRLCGVSGNHSQVRPLGSKNREFEEENLQKLIFWYLAERLSNNDSIVVNETCDRMMMDNVLGYKFLLLHGDGEKRIEDIARSSVNLYGKSIDFFVCGHYHKMQEYPAGMTPDGNSEIIRVPSICGTDVYAKNKGYGGRAGALALVIEQGHGCRCKYPIKLG